MSTIKYGHFFLVTKKFWFKSNNMTTKNTNKNTDLITIKETSFVCAVCYEENEGESGLVKPALCKHKICMECFSKIVMEHKENAKCPECRMTYLKQDENIKQDAAAFPFNEENNNENNNLLINDEIGQLNWNQILNSVNNTLNFNNIATYYEIDNYYYVEDRNGNLFITLN
jgi:hypothetical protein